MPSLINDYFIKMIKPRTGRFINIPAAILEFVNVMVGLPVTP